MALLYTKKGQDPMHIKIVKVRHDNTEKEVVFVVERSSVSKTDPLTVLDYLDRVRISVPAVSIVGSSLEYGYSLLKKDYKGSIDV